jgi:hypothetical protein
MLVFVAAASLPVAIAAEQESLEKIKAKAEQGDAESQFRLGKAYANGDGVAKSAVEAARFYRKAADRGHARAQNNLGSLYHMGVGVEQSDADAEKWIRRAAEQELPLAEDNLGMLLAWSLTQPHNVKEAADWFRKAAEQNCVEAKYDFGRLVFLDHEKHENQYEEGLRLLSEAASEKYAPAQTILGHVYEEGKGVPTDLPKAVEFFQTAAEAGDSEAQQNLGRLYENGTGVPQDFVRAWLWFALSSEQGNLMGQKLREELELGLERAKIEEGKRLLAEYHNKRSAASGAH